MNILQEEIKSLKNLYKIEPQIVPSLNYVLNENLYNGMDSNIIENFNCIICSYIIRNPVECKKCSKLFCGNCIEKAIENNNRCPNCLFSPFKKIKFNLLLKNLLEESEFKCPLFCGKVIKYSQQDLHKNECSNIKFIYKCTLCKIDVNSDKEEIHKFKCPLLSYKCVYCEQVTNKIDYFNHLMICQNQTKYCEQLQLYYPSRFEEAYLNEFKKTIMKYYLLYKNIKDISNIF